MSNAPLAKVLRLTLLCVRGGLGTTQLWLCASAYKGISVDATIRTEGVKLNTGLWAYGTICKGQAAAASGCQGRRSYALRPLEADFATNQIQ